ncbi:MAG: EAL domain-containing protein (putative c-di-GMP-specific phosphodiesterase class I) [Bermanella sp.]
MSAKPELCSRIALALSYPNLDSDIDCVREFVESFHQLRLPILLDDFGAHAHANANANPNGLLELATLPVACVRPHVQWFTEDSAEHHKMVSILVELIHAAGKQALGIGADTESGLINLQQQGFALVQGALYPAVPC